MTTVSSQPNASANKNTPTKHMCRSPRKRSGLVKKLKNHVSSFLLYPFPFLSLSFFFFLLPLPSFPLTRLDLFSLPFTLHPFLFFTLISLCTQSESKPEWQHSAMSTNPSSSKSHGRSPTRVIDNWLSFTLVA